MMFGNNHMTSGGWIVMVLATVIILALLATAAVWITSRLRHRRDGEASAQEILDRRLANGEIRIDQYEQLRSAIAGRLEVPSATP